jgi:ABC-type multidrug transport system ATPase subunit
VNIELSGITRRFGRTTAVDRVTLDTGPGVLGLLGPNGAGKTSLLRILATILPPSSGQIRLLGRDPARPAARREIRRRLGYLPQNLGYYPSFTVVEFVEYFALLKEMPTARVPRAVAIAAEYALLESWTSPWAWPVRPPDDRGAWLCACLVYAAGLAAFTLRGARSTWPADNPG